MDNKYHKNLHEGMVPIDVQLIELISGSNAVQEARQLLKEYGTYMYEELGLVAGKETFFKDLENFPAAAYLRPLGKFAVATVGNEPAGCVGIRRFDEESCEMKRMFIRPFYRGRGIGKFLCNYVIDWCHNAKFRRILLDSNIEMKEAVSLYHACGFKEIKPYCVNENDHPVFMEYLL